MDTLEKLKSFQVQEEVIVQPEVTVDREVPVERSPSQIEFSQLLTPQLLVSPQLLSGLPSKDLNKPLTIGICGGHSSGKSLLSAKLRKDFNKNNVATKIIKQDKYEDTKWDADASNDMYDLVSTEQAENWKQLEAVKLDLENAILCDYQCVVIVGTLILAYAPLRDMLDIKIFLDTDEDVRLSRLVYKEVYNNHKNVADPIKQYLLEFKPQFEKHIMPSKRYADIVIPDYGKGFATYKKEQSLGFSTYEHTIIDLLMTNVTQRITKQKKKLSDHSLSEEDKVIKNDSSEKDRSEFKYTQDEKKQMQENIDKVKPLAEKIEMFLQIVPQE